VKTYESGYAMIVVLMQGRRFVSYHSEIFHGAVLSYPTYDKELYALVQAVKKWKNYFMGKFKGDHHLDKSSNAIVFAGLE
jgi:hypothetical protein